MENVETLIGKQVSFGVISGTKLVPGEGTIATITIKPSMATSAKLGFVADRAGETVTVPSKPGQGKILGLKVVGGRKRKTMKHKRSKH